jgi:glucokinase
MPINSDGNRLEDVVSETGIVKRTLARLQTDHTSSLAQLDEEDIDLEDILAAAEAGDEFAALMIERTGTYLGVAIAGVINLLNVDTIVVGGTTMKAGGRLLDPAKDCAARLSFEPAFASTKIVAGKLGHLASARGAALLSRAKFTNALR